MSLAARPAAHPVLPRPLPDRALSALLVRADLPPGTHRLALGAEPVRTVAVTPDAGPGCLVVTLVGTSTVAAGAAVAVEEEVALRHAVAAGVRVRLSEVGQVLGPVEVPPGVVVRGGDPAYGPYVRPDPTVVESRPVRWTGVRVLPDDRRLVVTGVCGDDEELAALAVHDPGDGPVLLTVCVGTRPEVAEADAAARWRNRRGPRSLVAHTWAAEVLLPAPLAGRPVLDGAD